MFPTIIPHIIDQHAEESAFLWLLRSYAVHAPHYRLKDLAKLDNRVEAHLDGLRIAGAEGWDLCEQALKIGEAGELFAAGLLALETRDQQKIAKVIEVAETAGETSKGLVSAFGWTQPAKLAGTVQQLLSSKSGFQQLIGLSACSVHREHPGKIVYDLLRDSQAELPLRVRALRIAGELKCRDLVYNLRDCFRDEQAIIRFWAAWSSALLGNRAEALDVLKTFMVSNSGSFPSALPILTRALPNESARALLNCLAQYPKHLRDLIAGTGMVGDPLYIPWLIKHMEIPKLARAAGESFSLITGTDIAYLDLDGDKPEGFESGPTENPADTDVAMDTDENLPWPDPKKVQSWWDAKGHQFQTGVRYLLGEPITGAHCRKVLREGFQRQRAAAALELALMNPDQPLFEIRAPGWRQQRFFQQETTA